MQGKAKRTGMLTPVSTAAWKKAIVTLTADSKTIEFFEQHGLKEGDKAEWLLRTIKPYDPLPAVAMTVSGFDGVDKQGQARAQPAGAPEEAQRPQQLPAASPSAIRAAATAASIVSSTSSVRRPICPLPSSLSSTIRTAAHSSLWSSTTTAIKSYIIAPDGLKAGDSGHPSAAADIKPGNCLPFANIPVGTVIHNIELYPGRGAQLVRSAGNMAQLMAKENGYALVRLPSGEMPQCAA